MSDDTKELKSIEHTFTLKSYSGVIGFVLEKKMMHNLGLEVGDTVQIRINRIMGKPEAIDDSIPLALPILKYGPTSQRVTIDKDIVDALDLKEELQVIVEISNPKR